MRHLPGSRAPQALSVDGFQMKRPYRTPGTGIHNATRYHDTKGRPIFSSGRLRYGRVPYDTTPRGVRLAGQPVGATGWPGTAAWQPLTDCQVLQGARRRDRLSLAVSEVSTRWPAPCPRQLRWPANLETPSLPETPGSASGVCFMRNRNPRARKVRSRASQCPGTIGRAGASPRPWDPAA